MNQNICSINQDFEMQMSQLSRQTKIQGKSSEGKGGDTSEIQRDEICENIELRSRVIPSIPKVVEKEKELAEEKKSI